MLSFGMEAGSGAPFSGSTKTAAGSVTTGAGAAKPDFEGSGTDVGADGMGGDAYAIALPAATRRGATERTSDLDRVTILNRSHDGHPRVTQG